MATTRIMPLHAGKGRTVGKAISDIIDYVKNPEKTDHGRLITSYQCDSRVADAQFLLDKQTYAARTGRVRGADDVIAYHLRQSFVPGEITPEEANRLGVELARRFTKGKHAFIVCTHIDKAHVHNHIIWNSTTLECDRKFRNFWGSTRAVHRLSDTICIENGYSIVEAPKRRGQSYNKWLGDAAKPSHKELLRQVIDRALAQKPARLEDLLRLLEQDGFTVHRRGKTISISAEGWGNNVRFDRLGDGYTLDDLLAVLSGQKEHTPRKQPAPQAAPLRVNLLVDIQAKLQAGKGAGYARWAKVFNLKQMAQTLNYLSEHGLLDYADLETKTAEATAHYAAFVVIIECGMLLMVPFGGMFFLKGSLTASALLLFVYVGSLYLTEIRPLQELGTNFANVLNAVTKTKEILDIPIYEGGADFPQNHDIELRNVRFSYDGKTDVLQGVNLKIKDGERMALVGQSGAGKSTVIELISRFYDVQEGEVLIGGKNVKELNYETILKNVAIVFQKTFLTRDSVLENIRMGSNASLEEVRAAAREAQIDDFIMSLPDGYDTKVGSFGSRFSGGEKQRIAIARAILKNSPILILDEATSASDPENQMEIDKAIQNLCRGKTVIVVAHRLSALKMCDRVAVVENHTITCVGTHEEVRKKNEYYRKSWADYEAARSITYQLEGGERHDG